MTGRVRYQILEVIISFSNYDNFIIFICVYYMLTIITFIYKFIIDFVYLKRI